MLGDEERMEVAMNGYGMARGGFGVMKGGCGGGESQLRVGRSLGCGLERAQEEMRKGEI